MSVSTASAAGAGRILVLTPRPGPFRPLGDAGGVDELRTLEAADAGVEAAGEDPWELILVDSAFAGEAGGELALELASRGHAVLLVARTPSLQLTLSMLQGGVRDVLAFPPTPSRVLDYLGRGASHGDLLPLTELDDEHTLVGRDPRMLEIFRTVARLASSDTHVLVQGESGTGKATLAGALHRSSERRDRELVELSCGALPESLLESELFGHEAGTFPWAIARRRGRLERAHRSTLFLDDVDELPPRLQMSLLQVLRDGTVEHVGGTEPLPAEVRLVAASRKSPEELVDEGRLLEDLHHEIAPVVLEVPPLRERGDDVVLLARHFGALAARRYRQEVTALTREAADRLLEQPWPGNVRQLQQVMDRAVLVAEGPVLDVHHLPKDLRSPTLAPTEAGPDVPVHATLEEVEAAHIRRVVRSTEGNLTRAADILEIHRNTLRRKLDKYGIEAP